MKKNTLIKHVTSLAMTVMLVMATGATTTAYADTFTEFDYNAGSPISVQEEYLNGPYTKPTSDTDMSEQAVYNRMIALESIYPTGTYWDENTDVGYGKACGGFATMLNYAAFGGQPAYSHNDLTALHVGDEIYLPNHVMVVMKIDGDKITVADGNRNSKVSWNTVYDIKTLESISTGIGTYYKSDATEKASIAKGQRLSAEYNAMQNANSVTITLKAQNEKRTIDAKKATTEICSGAPIKDGTLKLIEQTHGVIITDSEDHTYITVTYNDDTKIVNIGETVTVGQQ